MTNFYFQICLFGTWVLWLSRVITGMITICVLFLHMHFWTEKYIQIQIILTFSWLVSVWRVISKSHWLLVIPTLIMCLIKLIQILKSVTWAPVEAPSSARFYAENAFIFCMFLVAKNALIWPLKSKRTCYLENKVKCNYLTPPFICMNEYLYFKKCEKYFCYFCEK